MYKQTLIIESCHVDAFMPTKGTEGSAGYDLYAYEDGCIPPYERQLIGTGIAMKIPAGWYGKIGARSGLAFNKGIQVMAGEIDNDYRGEINVLLFNSDEQTFHYKKGERIAQIIFLPYGDFHTEWGNVDETERGAGGFGSTGR